MIRCFADHTTNNAWVVTDPEGGRYRFWGVYDAARHANRLRRALAEREANHA